MMPSVFLLKTRLDQTTATPAGPETGSAALSEDMPPGMSAFKRSTAEPTTLGLLNKY